MKGYNYTIIHRYKKKRGIPYTNIKINGNLAMIVAFITLFILVGILYFIFSIEIVFATAVSITVASVILIKLNEIDEMSGLPLIFNKYYTEFKKYNIVIVEGVKLHFNENKKITPSDYVILPERRKRWIT